VFDQKPCVQAGLFFCFYAGNLKSGVRKLSEAVFRRAETRQQGRKFEIRSAKIKRSGFSPCGNKAELKSGVRKLSEAVFRRAETRQQGRIEIRSAEIKRSGFSPCGNKAARQN